jgi:glycerol uptake facilitator protein
MTPFLAEFIGTAIVIVIGNGVVANVVLPKTKGNNGGLISIILGWTMAVFIGVYFSSKISGAHLNPMVTISLANAGKFAWSLVPIYIIAQISGAMMGAFIVWMVYKDHFNETKDQALILACFATSPAIRNLPQNFIVETLASFVFMLAIFYIQPASVELGALGALPVALLVAGIGFGMGGPTGFAINPARDFGPRMMHNILPINQKGDSDWAYSLIPVLGPIVGGILASIIYVHFLQ